MGFNKKFVNKKIIKTYLNNGLGLKKLFNTDTIIFLDKKSSKVYNWFNEGLSDNEINFKLNKNGQKTT
jgi:hypothetical protein